MATQVANIQQNDSTGQLASILSLIKGSSQTTSTGGNLSTQQVQSLIQGLLGSTQGLAAVSSGQKSAGVYGSSTNSLLTNDLLSRITTQVAGQNAGTTSTTKKNPQFGGQDLLTLLAIQGGQKLLGPSLKKAGNPLDDLGNQLADSLFGSTTSSGPAGIGAATDASGNVVGAGSAALDQLGGDTTAYSVGGAGAAAGASDAALADASYSTAATTEGVGTAAEGASWLDSIATAAPEAAAAWVVCTELRAQGRLSDSLYAASALRALELSPTLMRGYHFWAIPLTRLMRRSPRLSSILAPIAAARCRYIMGWSSPVGWLTVAAGEPFCTLIGHCLPKSRGTNWKRLYG